MIRVKWYHYYVGLAMFDLLIIAASLWLHHGTLTSFGDLLSRAAVLDAHQRDLTSLGMRLVSLNAPGNDVFETRNIADERIRFQRLRGDLERSHHTGYISEERLTDYWSEVRDMCEAEERIFDLIGHAESNSPAAASQLFEASKAMAVMDKHQARALKILGREHEATMNETTEMLWRHQQVLVRQGRFEWIFVGALVLALVGMFWFFWKLQKTDESLIAERQRSEAERRDRLAAVGELCSSVAHGIQNPLAAIRSSTELILDLGKIDADTRRRATNVMTECGRLSRRVARLLNFSSAESRPRQEVDIVEAFEEAVEEVRARFDEQQVTIEATYENAKALVEADPDELATIFIELLSNALDYSPRGETVTASIRRDGNRAVVVIADRGPGVPAAAADKIFDLFFSTKESGTGIGLASVKRIVESMKGRVELASTPGVRGSVFRVTIPLHHSNPGLNISLTASRSPGPA